MGISSKADRQVKVVEWKADFLLVDSLNRCKKSIGYDFARTTEVIDRAEGNHLALEEELHTEAAFHTEVGADLKRAISMGTAN